MDSGFIHLFIEKLVFTIKYWVLILIIGQRIAKYV